MNSCDLVLIICIGVATGRTCTYCIYDKYCINDNQYSEVIPINLNPQISTQMDR